jgi:hypothetical protein
MNNKEYIFQLIHHNHLNAFNICTKKRLNEYFSVQESKKAVKTLRIRQSQIFKSGDKAQAMYYRCLGSIPYSTSTGSRCTEREDKGNRYNLTC